MDEKPKRRKTIRLPRANYVGLRAYFVTLCCESRREVFRDDSRTRGLIARLGDYASKHFFAIHAYCVMPNHLHILVEAREPTSDLLRFVNQLKQVTAYEEKKRSGNQLWQRYFYDHIIHSEDSMEAVAWYIWLNPVRKGLCAEPEDYPYTGSLTTDWKRKDRPASPWQPPWSTDGR